ncbi:MAG: Ig-like domain-containing protein, partial [Cyanobacteria bacterium P01_D01_bin.50]
TTVQMDVSNTSKISFELATGDRSKRIRGWDTPERGEEINFEYSVDGGKNWVEITSYGAGALPWKNYDVLIPTAARTTSTQFRWIQYKNSGNNFDNWAIDDLVIGSTKVEANIAPIFTSNATLKAIEEDTINPEGETIANLFQGKFKDSNSGSSLSGIAVVENKTDSSNQGSWQYSLDGKRWLNIGYVNDSSSALALSANTKIRFSAVANYHGKPKSLGVRALDDTFNKAFTDSRNSQKINTINNGGTTAISAKITEINTTIKEVNDKPIASNDTYWIAEGSTLETASAITSLVMFSDKGNYVGQGKNYNFTPDTGEFYGSYTFNNGVSVSYRDSARGGSSWVLSFLAPYYTPLEAGKTYSNAIDFGLQDFNQAGLSVNGEGRANSKLTGEFFVNQIIYGVNNKVTSFDGSFEQLGQGDTGLLRGKIKYNATQNNLLPGILSNDSDIDSKSLTTILVSAPSNGNLKLNSNGAFTYIPTAGFKGIDKFTYRTSDGKTTSDIATVTLKVGVSDAPFITASQYSISYIQNADDILINSFTSISDSDSPDLDGGQLKVSISDSTEDERLLIRNQGTNPTEINLEGNTIKYGNYEIATFTGGTQSQDLVVTLNKNARTKQVETLLKNITYGNFSQNPVSEQRKIEISLTDGDGGTSNIISRTIDVKNINEIPEIAILQTNPNDITGKLINGDSLNNTLYGGSLNDFFNGKEGDDFLYGRDGDDTLLGGSNDDLLQGDQGNDRLFGGSGKDTFVLSKFTGTDTIYDFENGIDSLGLSQSLTFNDLNIQANGNNTDILFGNQVLATLRGINSSLIEQSDFTTV